MPRQHTHHSKVAHDFPDDFPHRLAKFQEASGLSWAEIARRLGTTPYAISRIPEGRPDAEAAS
ncbi:MAG: helix-turn-helix transcriptional regulator [Chloroflexi bacterium]|nr:helix-turn-helix transcriptional regulator [Chloroflexota bacterium]MYE40932.1 helix-turn-helix transcriptional regulator [Chloroflexota bacterium]